LIVKRERVSALGELH